MLYFAKGWGAGIPLGIATGIAKGTQRVLRITIMKILPRPFSCDLT